MDSKVTSGNTLPSSLDCQVALVPVQKQEGGEDCGIFTIPFAVEMAYGGDPRTVNYQPHSMRIHLEHCLQEGTLTFSVCQIWQDISTNVCNNMDVDLLNM